MLDNKKTLCYLKCQEMRRKYFKGEILYGKFKEIRK